jgi:amino acid transporter
VSADDQRGASTPAAELTLKDVTASTVANIGPGIDFYFAFGVIAVTAGVGAPLTILAAGVAAALLAFVVAEFTRIEPSAGSFVTYVETSLGARAGAATSVLIAAGFTIAIAGVFTMSGGMIALTLAHYTAWHPSWVPITVVMTAAGFALTLRGASPSTAVVTVALVCQLATMIAACVVVFVKQGAHLTSAPFSPSHLNGGLTGLSAGFPLALYMFIGWENGPALAEETRDPARTIPRALYISIAAATLLFAVFAYATIVGFHYDTSSIGRASVPFLEMADRYLGSAAVLAWLAGILSVLSTLVAAANAQARVLFDAGRSGLLPAWLGRARAPGQTPVAALWAMTVVGLAIVVIWWLCHVSGLVGGSTDPVNLYAECSTLGTILILFVYVLTAASLPVFIRRHHAREFSIVRHAVMPLLGVLTLVVPFIELFQPGQPVPYSIFPYAALGTLLASGVYALYVLARNPRAGSSEGSLVTRTRA